LIPMTETPEKYNFKCINDPVHGTIGLSELEVEIINTNVFQRLRTVKQLGLANYVFPSADFTRFSHSLGVCHLTGKIFKTLKRNGVYEITDEDIRNYRLAGLLHDIGHYPYSHNMEDAIQEYYDPKKNDYIESLISEKSGDVEKESIVSVGKKVPTFLNHMSVGREILIHDSQIQKIFKENEIDAQLIYSIFTRDNNPKYSSVISSDLDADRIDYLLRSASNTGLPYGSVDINYLVSQMRVDNNGKFCITPKALRTADHFHLCRYFEYSQVIHHKTVAAFELILKEVIFELLGKEESVIDCSTESIIKYIENGFWNQFDDSFILQEIRNLREDHKTPMIIQEKAKSILDRIPPKEICKIEYISERDEKEKTKLKSDIQRIESLIPGLAEKYQIDRQFWRVWGNQIKLTIVGRSVESNKVLTKSKAYEDDYDQTVNVLNRVTGESSRIMEIDNSLMSVLANKSLFTIRLYILFPSNILPDDRQKIKDSVFEQIKKEFPYFSWK
jgi:uncharacterized protein